MATTTELLLLLSADWISPSVVQLFPLLSENVADTSPDVPEKPPPVAIRMLPAVVAEPSAPVVAVAPDTDVAVAEAWARAIATSLPADDYDVPRATNAARAAEAGVHADATAATAATGKAALTAGRAVG